MANSAPGGEDPVLQFLKVPYICGYDQSRTQIQFQDIPACHGINWEAAQDPSLTGLDPDKAAAFLQEWLFFGALNGVCKLVEVDFEPGEFISCLTEAKRHVTGSHFRNYVWCWAGGLELGTSTVEGRYRKQREGATLILHTLEIVTEAWIRHEGDSIATSSTLEIILFSIVQLGAHLRTIFESLFSGPGLSLSKEPLLKSYPNFGRDLLLQAGWCVGELPALLPRYRPYTLLYLSTIDKRRKEKDHSRCTEDGCIVNQLDGNTYMTSHGPGCQAPDICCIVHAPVKEICDILQAGNIPLLRTSAEDDFPGMSLQVESFTLGPDNEPQSISATKRPSYVAISHVWSDGMGNPTANALYACQIRRLQQAASGLYPAESGLPTPNTLFWNDTLCVPHDPALRTLAIIRMSRTYMHSDKVLVIDNWLTESSLSSYGSKNMLFRIIHSDWSTRLWTFHEAVLARELYFQFADAALTIDQLEAAAGEPSTLEELSDVLSSIKEDKILGAPCTLNLLRALGHVDPKSIDRSERIKRTAILPPQSDPRQELNRLIAIDTESKYNSLCQIVEKWFPVLAKADSSLAKPADDLVRLDSLLRPLHTDPVRLHASGAAELIRGMGYDTMTNRSKDLNEGSGRQLQGIENTPSGLLASIVNGVRRRTTSWTEDETICLGSIAGLDLTPIAQIRADPGSRAGEASQVAEERMKYFLSTVKNLPESILFLPTNRMTRYPWSWAPTSFLNTDWNLPFAEYFRTECTDRGLLVTCDTIQLAPRQSHIVEVSGKAMSLRQRIPRGYSLRGPAVPNSRPLKGVFFSAHILEQHNKLESSWHDFLSEQDDELYLLKRSYPLRRQKDADAVLVRLLDVKDDTLFGRFLAKVHLVHTATEEKLKSCIFGDLQPTKIKWCVG